MTPQANENEPRVPERNNTLRFAIAWLIFSGLVFVLFSAAEAHVPARFASPYGNGILVLMMVASLALHLGLQKARTRGNAVFIRFFMAATAIKLFIFMGVLVIFSLFNKAEAVGFIMHFAAAYLLFTAFEVAMAYREFSR